MSEKFTYQRPDEDGTAWMLAVRDSCARLESIILENVAPGRCQSLALTKLEEVSMWANKGIVFKGRA